MAIGAALSAIGGLVGGLASAGANLYMNERNNDANAAQARLQNQWNIEQWNRENEYNLPVNQVQRMKDAGINPGLYYGQNQMMNEAAASPEMTSAAGQLRAGYIDPMMLANIGLINAQKDKVETETDAISQKLPEEVTSLRKQNEQQDVILQNLQVDVAKKTEEIDNLKKQNKVLDQQALNYEFEREFKTAEFKLHEREFELVKNRTLAEMDKWLHENALTDQEKALKKSLIALNNQEFQFNIQANVERMLGLKLDNANKKMDIVLDIDTHQMYGQQIKLNGFDLVERDATGKVFSGWQKSAGSVGTEILRTTYFMLNKMNPIRFMK